MRLIFHARQKHFLSVSDKERQETIEKLVYQGTLHSGYYLLLLLATFVVVPGLFIDNVSIVIGGMILAPLLVPILSFSLSLVALNKKGLLRSTAVLIRSILLVIATSAAMTFIFQSFYDYVPVITLNVQPEIYLFIAFCSGMAGSFAWVKEDLSSTIAGVATAVALLPPLCQVGMGLVLNEPAFAYNSLIIFLVNFLGILLAAAIVFYVLGFFKTAHLQEKIIEKASKD